MSFQTGQDNVITPITQNSITRVSFQTGPHLSQNSKHKAQVKLHLFDLSFKVQVQPYYHLLLHHHIKGNLKMDKTWMRCTDTSSDVYLKGVDNFLQFAFQNSEVEREIPCPCTQCNNVSNGSRDEVKEHLILFGIVKGYTHWLQHGEFAPKKKIINQDAEGKEQGEPSQKKRKERDDDMFEMIYDAVDPEIMDDSSGVRFQQGDASEPTSKIFKLLEDASQQLYSGCDTFSKLSLIVKLFQIKCLHGLSDKATDSILKLIKRALPSDSEAWKYFDTTNPGFARDPRNVRLGLASDGQPYCYLSLLIPGPKAPRNDIDVYLEPLIDELRELWYYGVDTFDVSRKENFCMRATLLWTINDFPAYANFSGWSTKGALACPSCNKDTPSTRLKYGRKFSYMGARRFLASNHKWRSNKRDFNGEVERRPTPNILLGDDAVRQLLALGDMKFAQIPITLSKLEKIFLPAFFDVMVHLVIHLPREAKLGGPVQNRWIYPIERNHPEGCMAEGYIVEECIILCSRFHTKLLEEKRKTQNSGVLVKGVVNGQNINYYGVLTEIVELQYFRGKRIVLFKCDWWDVDNSGNGVKIDKHDYVSVNTKRKLAKKEPFVLASQVEHMFYVKDNLHPNWSIVLNGHSSYFTGGTIDEETFQQDACNDFSHRFEDDEDFINWKRNDLDVISTDVIVADDFTEDNESES
ncbi:hypothetical protein KY284_030340 [Solanum tuberosum]|nr:hypothetical protein KY284_030340 [Solanum tuberosum]